MRTGRCHKCTPGGVSVTENPIQRQPDIGSEDRDLRTETLQTETHNQDRDPCSRGGQTNTWSYVVP